MLGCGTVCCDTFLLYLYSLQLFATARHFSTLPSPAPFLFSTPYPPRTHSLRYTLTLQYTYTRTSLDTWHTHTHTHPSPFLLHHLQIKPNNAVALANLAAAYKDSGQLSEAIKCYQVRCTSVGLLVLLTLYVLTIYPYCCPSRDCFSSSDFGFNIICTLHHFHFCPVFSFSYLSPLIISFILSVISNHHHHVFSLHIPSCPVLSCP